MKDKPTTTKSPKDETQSPSLPKNYGTLEWYEEVEERYAQEALERQRKKQQDNQNN